MNLTLPTINQRLVDPNRRIDPNWLRSLQAMSTILQTLQNLTDEEVGGLLERFQTEIEKLQSEKLSRAEWDAENGETKTQLDDVRNQINRIGDEVKEATQTSLKTRTELYGQNEQRVKEIKSLVAKTNASNANIVNLEEVFATEQQATANKFTQVETSIGNNSTAVTDLTSSVNGIAAQRTISVNSNGDVDGYVQISGQGGVSEFSVVADNFKVSHPNAGNPIAVFVTELDDNNSPVIRFSGTINGDQINVSSLSALSANMGNITAGILQSANGKTYWNLDTGVRWTKA